MKKHWSEAQCGACAEKSFAVKCQIQKWPIVVCNKMTPTTLKPQLARNQEDQRFCQNDLPGAETTWYINLAYHRLLQYTLIWQIIFLSLQPQLDNGTNEGNLAINNNLYYFVILAKCTVCARLARHQKRDDVSPSAIYEHGADACKHIQLQYSIGSTLKASVPNTVDNEAPVLQPTTRRKKNENAARNTGRNKACDEYRLESLINRQFPIRVTKTW